MSAPNLHFTATKQKLSSVSGFDCIVVAFTTDVLYTAFECRATKIDEEYGVGRGTLVASFSQTPAHTERAFEIYDEFLVDGDGEYRISLFAKGPDGSWNDNHGFIPAGSIEAIVTADGEEFLCMR